MNESLDARLSRAGRVDTTGTDAALLAVADEARPQSRRRPRRLVPAIVLGATLALAAPVAVAATQWGPWLYVTDPDLVVAREWTDVDGVVLGSCESRLEMQDLPDDVQADAAAYLDSLGVATLEPDAESIATQLESMGRLDEIGRFVEGAQPSDFDVAHEGELVESDMDARILQESLLMTIGRDLGETMLERHPDALANGFGSEWETQCTAAPEMQQP